VDAADPIEPGGPPNILFLIGDDMGVERLAAYQEPISTLGYPNTPSLDALAADGVLFRNAYTNPMCSPTRYSAGYGRYSRRGGVGRALRFDKPFEVSTAEVNVAEVLRDAGYSTTAIGKWHLSSRAGPTNVTHPLREGFDHFSGTLGNLGPNYTDWNKTIDGGSPSRVSGYITSDTVDDALNRANTLPEPWFLWVAFHAAHRPWHVPPAALHTTGVTESSSDEEKFHAMIEAMDTEIGRLLVSIDPAVMENTVVVFLGDNGSKNDFIPASWDPSAGKGSPYESGINVPLIIQTPKTIGRGRQSEVMVHSVDLLPTFAELPPTRSARTCLGRPTSPRCPTVCCSTGPRSRRPLRPSGPPGRGSTSTWSVSRTMARRRTASIDARCTTVATNSPTSTGCMGCTTCRGGTTTAPTCCRTRSRRWSRPRLSACPRCWRYTGRPWCSTRDVRSAPLHHRRQGGASSDRRFSLALPVADRSAGSVEVLAEQRVERCAPRGALEPRDGLLHASQIEQDGALGVGCLCAGGIES